MSADTAEGEFRVPDDVEDDVESDVDADATADDTARRPRRPTFHRRRRHAIDGTAEGTADDTDGIAGADITATDPDDFADVDLSKTPGPMVGAVALGVVAAPLLGVYAVLFITRYFLKPGVEPDITGSWTGEGISGVVAALLALAVLVVVARAAGGRGLPVFVGAQLLVVATCGYLLSDSSNGGARVSVTVGVVSLAAAALALLPVSRRWFGAHAADRAEHGTDREEHGTDRAEHGTARV